jgi:DUF4097 and DUF4098 domain-containing protein YvlB
MNRSLSIAAKLTILIIVAVMFAATMIALSVRSHSTERMSSSSFGWGSDKKIEKSFSVEPNGNLVIEADEGNIAITGTDGKEVVVHVTARGSDELLQKFDVSFNQEGNTVRVDGRKERRYFRFFNNNSLDVQFDIKLPVNFNLNLHTSGGDIVVHNVKGRIDGETSGGDLDLTSLEGPVKLSTSGGNVTVHDASGDLTLETSGGNIQGESLNGTMRLETSGGNIELRDSDGKLHASTSGGNIRVKLKDNKGIDLSSSGGNLSLLLPKSISADIHAEATGGDVNCDFQFSGKLKEGTLKGKINGGGNAIDLETSGGDITIGSVE